MMFSRMDGTSKMLHDVDLLAGRLGAATSPGSARTIQKGLCCVGACNKWYRRCNEQPRTWISSLRFSFTEASECTRGHPARRHHPGRPAAAEAWCVSTKDLTVFFFRAGAPCDQPIVETISAKRSNVYFDRCLHFACDFATEVSDVGRSHGNQERVAKVSASWEDKRCVDLPLPSCAFAVHSIPTTASTDVESVVHG